MMDESKEIARIDKIIRDIIKDRVKNDDSAMANFINRVVDQYYAEGIVPERLMLVKTNDTMTDYPNSRVTYTVEVRDAL